jgi:hypothetical protein
VQAFDFATHFVETNLWISRYLTGNKAFSNHKMLSKIIFYPQRVSGSRRRLTATAAGRARRHRSRRHASI